jgi:hypothetical protein
MKQRSYRTITGRRLDVGELDASEGRFLAAVQERYERDPEWSVFASWWSASLREAGIPRTSPAYRICQDLEARLGIAQGAVAPPDYRDYLADLIEERYGSRYRFCKETGVDPGLQYLQKVLGVLHAALVIQPEEELAERVSRERGARELARAAG